MCLTVSGLDHRAIKAEMLRESVDDTHRNIGIVRFKNDQTSLLDKCAVKI